MNKEVHLIENFVSWQGEGIDSGQSMIILRFKTCNLKCHWCDTSVKMRISAEAPYLLSDLQKMIYKTRSGIMITGGEPTVPKHIDEALLMLNDLKYPIANVETNGFNLERLLKETDITKKIHFMYSPKIFNTDDLENALIKTPTFLKDERVFIKIVYENRPVVVKYLEKISEVLTSEMSRKVWLMPQGITRTELITNSSTVFDACEKYRFNFSSRDHIIFGFV